MRRQCWLLAGWLAAMPALAVDWAAYSADRVEEAGGGAALFQAGADPASFGLGLEFATRLRGAPWLGSSFASLLWYDFDAEALFGEPSLTLRLTMPGWRLAPYAGGGGSYRFCFSEIDDGTDADAATRAGYDRRDDSHWAAHLVAGLRLRLAGGQYIELGAVWQHPFLDLPPDESNNEIVGRLALGYEP